MYTSGELARKCNVSRRTVQYYDQCGLLTASRTPTDQRQYNDADVQRLREILAYRNLGFSLKEVKRIITNQNSSKYLLSLITSQQDSLTDKVAKLNQQIASLDFLKKQFDKYGYFPGNIAEGVAYLMDQAQRLRRLRIKMIVIGIILDICLWGSVCYVVLQKANLWYLGIGLIVSLILGYYITMTYFHHSCYLCPNCHSTFTVPFKNWFFAKHTPNTRHLKCSHCHQVNYCIEEFMDPHS
jgi:DNA-binding transcriptional MerR regulator